MTKDLVSLREEQPLSLKVAGFDDAKLGGLVKTHQQQRQVAIQAGLKADRERVLREFTPDKIEQGVLNAMAEGRSSFDLNLNEYDKKTSIHWDYKGAVSKQVLGEINAELKSSSMLTGVSLAREQHSVEDFLMDNGWTLISGFSIIPYGIMTGIGATVVVGALSLGTIPTIGVGALATYGALKATKETMNAVNHHVYDDYYDGSKLTVHFNNPNKSFLSLPRRALNALSNGVGAVVNALNPAIPSAKKIEELKSAFSRSYKEAAQGVIDGAKALTEYAHDRGLDFSVDVDRFIELSNRQIELVETRYSNGGFAQRAERLTTMPLTDIGKAMSEASKMVTIDQNYTSQLQKEFERMTVGVEANVAYAESEARMRSIGDIGVGLSRLMR